MQLLKKLNLDNLLFFDIETVYGTDNFTPEHALWHAWDYKMKHGREPIGGDDNAAEFYKQAALYPEFGKIVCISIGKIVKGVLKLKSYASHNEKELLQAFCADLDGLSAKNKYLILAGHAVKGFDIPWLVRRCIVHGVELPSLLDVAHLKPWEQTTIDTMELWKAGGFNGASLIAIAACLGLADPKDEIEGCETSHAYYKELDGLATIKRYCEKDVLTVANVILRMRYEPTVTADLSAKTSRVTNTEIVINTDPEVGPLEATYNAGPKLKHNKLIKQNMATLTAEEQRIATEILNVATNKA